MPKNKVNDPITDQEIAFARLVLSGAMTDRQAAEAVGLNPDSAAYTKSKPRVRAYMLEHRAAVQQQLVQQEAEGLHRLNLDREQVLARLWEIANLSPEMTRGSITGQVKALSMIVAMQNFIPDRPRPSCHLFGEKIPACAHPRANPCRCLPAPACRGLNKEEDSPAVPACPGEPWKPAPGSTDRGASEPWPQPLLLRQPLSLFGGTASGPLRPRHETGFLYKKEPVCPSPLSCQSSKTPKNIKF